MLKNRHTVAPANKPVPHGEPRPRSYFRPAHRVLALALSLAATPLGAQSLDYEKFEALFGEPITASVTGSPQRASAVPATMEIITAEQIRRSGGLDIPAVLRHVTGLDVLRWTNNSPDLAVRGYNQSFSPRLLVLVNGRQVYADHYGYTPWGTLPIELGDIRQIEVVKGPNSALFGFNAVGGVINIVTYAPGDDRAFVEVRGGTQQHLQGSFASSFALGGRGHARVSAGLRRNDDFSTPTTAANQATRVQNERQSVRVDAHVNLKENIKLDLESSWTGTLQNGMSPVYMFGVEDMVVKSVMAALTADTTMGLTQVRAYRNWIHNEVFTPDTTTPNPTLAQTPFLVLDNELSVLQLEQIVKAGTNHTFRLSGEYRQGSLGTTPITGGSVYYDVLAPGAMWQWQVMPALSLTIAARYDMLDLGRRGPIPPGLGLTNADWDRSIAQSSYNAGAVWSVNAVNTVRLTSARGVQLPSLFNLGGFLFAIPVAPGFDVFASGLPSLEAATVSNQELAWDRKLPAWNGQLRVALFRGTTRRVNAIGGATDIARGIVSAPANIGDSSTRGAEMSIKSTIGDNWRWGAGYLHQDVDDSFLPQYPVAATFVDYAATTSRHSGTASVGWSHAAWEADLFARYQSDRLGFRAADSPVFDPANPPNVFVAIPGHAAFDARLGYRFDERVTLAMSGQNLFTREQTQTSGPRVGRRLIASLNYRF